MKACADSSRPTISATGKEVWRFWTVPKPGEPGSETWKGNSSSIARGATWMTGTYDPQLDLVYWPAGNPGPDYNGDDRQGDNLYTRFASWRSKRRPAS